MSSAHLLSCCSTVAQLPLHNANNNNNNLENAKDSLSLSTFAVIVLVICFGLQLVLSCGLWEQKKCPGLTLRHTLTHTPAVVVVVVADLLWLHLIKTVLQCERSLRAVRCLLHG